MFANCTNIESVNLMDFNINNIINMEYMFYGCLIKEINLFSLNAENIKNMNNMFSYCKNLKILYLPFFNDDSKISMRGMFEGCSSLPDISKWNMKNINDISKMFKGCSTFKTLPDISKWNTENINNISELFEGCSSLKSLPDISNWNTKNVKYITGIFKECSSLKYLPDISKWNIKNINDISELFEGCSSLISLPDISKWKIDNINNISKLFKGCSSLRSLPDISKWNAKNIHDLGLIFKDCISLKSFPNISRWINKNIYNLTIFGDYPPLPESDNGINIKIVLNGESGVGCNTLAHRATGKEFISESAVLNYCYTPIKFFVNYREIEVSLLNGPGQERFRSLSKFFLKNANIILFVYDITYKQSYDYLDERIEMAKKLLENKFIGAIIANKNDLFLEEKINEEKGREFAKKQNYKFYLVSAKDNPQAFINCLDELVKDYILANHPDLLK